MLSGILSLATLAFAITPQLANGPRPDIFTHPECSGYELSSVDPSSLGIDSVKQQSGYLTTPSGNSLFYWYFESRSDPTNDPTLIWLNGGPGCSSLEAILFENGPSSIDTDNKTTRNPWSWNNKANVLYIDNPAGVGYSIAKKPISNTVSASYDFKNAVKLFFEKNTQLKKNKLHIAGESYAGRYIPVFAADINEYDRIPVKVSSILIGNGLVNPVTQFEAYQPMLCGKGGYPPVLSEQKCRSLKEATPDCVRTMTRCMNDVSAFECSIAQYVCSPLLGALSGLNPYDIRQKRCQPSKLNLCYDVLENVQEYFNQAKVQQALGVHIKDYQICNLEVNYRFQNSDDPFYPTFKNVTSLLEGGTATLVYNGDADIILNWLGSRLWTDELQWPGQHGFQRATLSDWKPHDGHKRGEVKNYDNFTFLRVSEAGHMVPHDQPESAYYMISSWLEGDYAFKKTF